MSDGTHGLAYSYFSFFIYTSLFVFVLPSYTCCLNVFVIPCNLGVLNPNINEGKKKKITKKDTFDKRHEIWLRRWNGKECCLGVREIESERDGRRENEEERVEAVFM